MTDKLPRNYLAIYMVNYLVIRAILVPELKAQLEDNLSAFLIIKKRENMHQETLSKVDWVYTSRLRHTESLLPLLSSEPGGIYNLPLRRADADHGRIVPALCSEINWFLLQRAIA